MKTYIGIKAVEAEPRDYSPAPTQADPLPESDPSRPGYRVVYPDGYVSWSPKDVFEAAYREVPFDDADALEIDLRDELETMLQPPTADEGEQGFQLRLAALDFATRPHEMERASDTIARARDYLAFLNGEEKAAAVVPISSARVGADLRTANRSETTTKPVSGGVVYPDGEGE